MELQKLTESLSPNERKVLPHLEDSITNICKKTNLDKISVLRALEYLENKEIIKLTTEKKKIVDLGVNGTYYLKKGLPERRLLTILSEKRILSFEEAEKASGLSENEFKASLGALKRKALVDIKNGKIIINANNEEIAKKSLEELFLEILPVEYNNLAPEQLFALKTLESRKEIVEIKEESLITIKITELGKKLMNTKELKEELIEAITPELLVKESWKGKKFRRYDVSSPVPEISGGKRHFVNQSIEYARKIWTDMGFKEMTGNMVVSSFWNFDALFQPQDHPARELADTFFINKFEELPENKKLVKAVKDSHEKGVGGSNGWQYNWEEKEAKRLVMRTHTTALSSKTIASLNKEDLPAKFFAIGKCFRNETVDWSHGFEFYQTEGIVIDKDANFRHLLGYLKQFYAKMGFDKIRIRPSYFPYTEPSVEVDVWHPERKVWLEMGGAGMFRPEVTIPLFGEHVPILAWGQGMDRMMMDFYKIKDLREVYKNNLTQLRKMKFWSRK